MADNNLTRFLSCYTEVIQETADHARQVLLSSSIARSSGKQLDDIGEIVKQKRNGIDDDTYKRYLSAKIAVNDSDGLIDDIITIAKLAVDNNAGDYDVTNWGNGSMALTIKAIALAYPVALALIDMLRKAVSGGVRLVLVFSLRTTPLFHFARYDGTFDAGTGFLSFDETTGGHLADSLE